MELKDIKGGYRDMRQAWRHYRRTHKVDLAILHQVDDLLAMAQEDGEDDKVLADIINAQIAIRNILNANKQAQESISKLLTRLLERCKTVETEQ